MIPAESEVFPTSSRYQCHSLLIFLLRSTAQRVVEDLEERKGKEGKKWNEGTREGTRNDKMNKGRKEGREEMEGRKEERKEGTKDQ